MEQPRNSDEPRQVRLSTAILMTAGGLLVGMVMCLCAGTFALVITSSARGLNPITAAAPVLTASRGGGAISYGETVNGSIWDYNGVDEWTFEGEDGDRVTIEVLADAYSDPWVWLIGPDGEVLGENDDSFGGLDSYLSLELPDDGTYTIRIEMLSTGGYTLSLDD